MLSQNFTFKDSSQISLSLFQPRGEVSEVIIIYPALGVRASYYNLLGEQLAEAGFMVITCDWRGHGSSTERPKRGVDYGYESYVMDMDEVIDWAKLKWNGKKVSVLGHSLGGQIACLHRARFPEKIDRIILSASCSLHIPNWPASFRWKLVLAGRLLPLIGDILGYYPGDKLGFGGREFKSVMKDWGKSTHNGEYFPKDTPFNYEQAFPQSKPEILGIHYTGDKWVTEEAVKHLANKFHEEKNFNFHIIKGYSHFSWAKKPEETVQLIVANS
ncbi:MAG: alpha/beta hydrolase [Bacteroidia bacterium]|nr:alpha/beta hydrolase [Bacteroidia bacterium]